MMEIQNKNEKTANNAYRRVYQTGRPGVYIYDGLLYTGIRPGEYICEGREEEKWQSR